MHETQIITAVIDAFEGRDVMSSDVPNAFIQTNCDSEEEIIMKISGQLVWVIVRLKREYAEFVTWENGQPVLYV